VLKPDENNPPVFTNTTACRRLISLDSLSPLETSCLHQFRYLYPPNSHGRKFTYELVSLNNQFDYSIFYVDQKRDCLGLQQLNGLNKNFLAGEHELRITASDEYRRSDSLVCSIYVTQSCQEVVSVYTELSGEYVRVNLEAVVLANLSSAVSSLLGREIKALSDGVYSYPVGDQNRTETFLLVAFYDRQVNKFLVDSEVVAVLSANLNIVQIRDLRIGTVRSSCPLYVESSCVLLKAGVLVWSVLLLLMLLLAGGLVLCVLCYRFKVLKYQNNRIIMKQSIIPIMEDCQSNFQYGPNENGCMSECASGVNSQLRFGGDEKMNLDEIEEVTSTSANKFK